MIRNETLARAFLGSGKVILPLKTVGAAARTNSALQLNTARRGSATTSGGGPIQAYSHFEHRRRPVRDNSPATWVAHSDQLGDGRPRRHARCSAVRQRDGEALPFLLVAERETDPSDDSIPLSFFRGRIIDQNAIHEVIEDGE